MIAGFVIWSAVSLLLAGIGVWCLRSDKAVGFYTGVKPPEVTDVRKYNHSVGRLWFIYALLFELLYVPLLIPALHDSAIVSNLLPVIGASSLSFLCGYAIELCQPHFGRYFEVADLVADALGSYAGAVLGLVCVFFMCFLERRRRHR